MLKGKDFGNAIKAAIALKIESGGARSKAEIARHFGVRPPSLEDWIKKGAISKERLPQLWQYFSDVVGYDHWGLSEQEWPLGLSSQAATSMRAPQRHESQHVLANWPLRKSKVERIFALKPDQQNQLDDALDILLKGFESHG